jgi:hypothetical protein
MSKAKKSRTRGSSYYSQMIRSDPCVFCGRHKGKKGGITQMTVDHIHPTCKGGGNNWMNFAPSCSTCNNRKGALSLLENLMGFRRDGECLEAEQITDEYGALPDRWFDPLGIYPFRERVMKQRNRNVAVHQTS